MNVGIRNREAHASILKMRIDRKKCCYCGGCVGACPLNALELWETELVVDEDKCTDCGICVKCCPVGAIEAD